MLLISVRVGGWRHPSSTIVFPLTYGLNFDLGLYRSESPSQVFLAVFALILATLERVERQKWSEKFLAFDNMFRVSFATIIELPLPVPFNTMGTNGIGKSLIFSSWAAMWIIVGEQYITLKSLILSTQAAVLEHSKLRTKFPLFSLKWQNIGLCSCSIGSVDAVTSFIYQVFARL